MPESERQTLLVLRAQCGDRAAFEELLAGVEVRLLRYLAGLIGDSHAAEDVLQETFVIVWKKLGWLRDPELFRPWIHRIAVLEAAMLALVLSLMNFKDRTQVIVLLTSVMVYTVLAVGMVVLGTYTKLSAERVLKAISLLHERPKS